MANFEDLIGAPFRIGGRGPNEFDCYGLVMEMSRRAGIELPDFGASSEQAMQAAMMLSTMPQWEQVEKGKGAIVLMRIGRFVSHVGYMLDDYRMLHCWEHSHGVSVVNIDEWQHRVIGFYKHVGS